jgi:D-3-phosphoglycerate dehydrogenase
MARPLVVITNPTEQIGLDILAPHAEVITAPDPKDDTLRKLVKDADALIVRTLLPPDIFDNAPKLLIAARHGAGLDFIPMPQATAHGVVVTNVPAVNANAVAEYVVTQMLLSARPLHRVDRLHRDKTWGEARVLSEVAIELKGATLGIVGVGAIGTRLAEIAHHGFQMKVIGNQRRLDAMPKFVSPASVDELFAKADFIALACPLTDATRGLASKARIASMKPGAMLVNVSRGPVVDEAALTEALAAGRIRGAGLDVYEKQPLARDSKLLGLDNVVLSTHLAGITSDSVREMSRISCEETVRVLKGEKPVNLCNPEVWEKRRRRPS